MLLIFSLPCLASFPFHTALIKFLWREMNSGGGQKGTKHRYQRMITTQEWAHRLPSYYRGDICSHTDGAYDGSCICKSWLSKRSTQACASAYGKEDLSSRTLIFYSLLCPNMCPRQAWWGLTSCAWKGERTEIPMAACGVVQSYQTTWDAQPEDYIGRWH